MTTPVPHFSRQYNVCLRGPATAVVYAFSVSEVYRAGIWHRGTMTYFPAPSESGEDEFGIISGGGFTVELADDSDVGYADYLAMSAALRNQQCDVELLTTLTLTDGTLQEISRVRRALCKSVSRKKNIAVLKFVDVDRAALDKPYPFDLFTVADFPQIFADHVGRRIPRGVGTVVKVPLTWIKNTGGVYRYAGPIYDALNTLLTVYRGDQPGKGLVVPVAEYTQSTAVGLVSGINVNAIDFALEQVDFQGRPYVLEADYVLFGAATPSGQVRDILTQYGISTNLDSFADASGADLAAGFYPIAALYGGDANGRTGRAIIEDLLRLARGWLSQNATGEWIIVQDIAKSPVIDFDAKTDEIEIEEYGDGDAPASVSLEYRPHASGVEKFSGRLSRTTGAATGTRELRNPYFREHVIADRLLSYWQQRLSGLRICRASLHAVQVEVGSVLSITDLVTWTGKKDFIVTGITRDADKNAVTLREYNAAVYTYTAATLPSDPAGFYGPDYTFTPPLAPTALHMLGLNCAIDGSGKAFAVINFGATPPAVNWAEIWGFIKNNITNGVTPAFKFEYNSPGVYRLLTGNLQPGTSHTISIWARNAAGLDGAVATSTFTTISYTGAPPTPGWQTITQLPGRSIEVTLQAPTYPHHFRTEWHRKAGIGGSYSVVPGEDGASLTTTQGLAYGNTYYFKARFIDASGNAGSFSSEQGLTLSAIIDDSHITGSGVNAVSIGNASINQSRSNTFTSSVAGSVAAGGGVTFGLGKFAFWPRTGVTNIGVLAPKMDYISFAFFFDEGTYTITNPLGFSIDYFVEWRNFTP